MKTKTIILLNVLLVMYHMSYAQKIAGKYTYSVEHGQGKLNFKGKHFKDQIYDGLGTLLSVGMGEFEVNGNQLTLKYKEIKNRDSSAYTITKIPAQNNSSQVSIQVSLEDSSVIAVSIFLNNQDGNAVKRYNTDSLGKCSFRLDSNPDYKTLKIVQIPYYPIIIPIERLKNRSSTIIAKLKEVKLFYMPADKLDYTIDKNAGDKIILKADNDREIVWKRRIKFKKISLKTFGYSNAKTYNYEI